MTDEHFAAWRRRVEARYEADFRTTWFLLGDEDEYLRGLHNRGMSVCDAVCVLYSESESNFRFCF